MNTELLMVLLGTHPDFRVYPVREHGNGRRAPFHRTVPQVQNPHLSLGSDWLPRLFVQVRVCLHARITHYAN